MLKRKLVLAAVAATAIFTTVPAAAQVYLEYGPPAPRHEDVPRHRAGYVWQPGYWAWENGRHAWVRGHWVRERRGMYWHPAHWEEAPDGRFVFVPGRWARERYVDNSYRRGPYGDRDRDGVPNRYDRDRDNDGIPNRYDERPNNPRY